jgi:hypothetical protein
MLQTHAKTSKCAALDSVSVRYVISVRHSHEIVNANEDAGACN